MTDAEWAEKVAFEGGVIPAFEGGLKPDDLETGGDREFLTSVNRAWAGWRAARDDIQVLEDLVREMEP